MKINEIVLTPEELHVAVQDWLQKRGLFLEVTEISGNGYPVRDYDVTCQSFPAQEKAPIKSIEDLTVAIEKGDL